MGGGGAQPNISKEKIVATQIPIPPLAEQQRIVAEIERWFALVDIIEQRKDNLQATIAQAKSKILDLAIHGKLVPQDPSDEPAIEQLRRINPQFTPCDNAHYPQLPHGWCVATMCELFILNPKNKVDNELEAGFIPMGLVNDGYSGTHTFERRRWGEIKKDYCHFTNGDIAVAKILPCFENRKSTIFKEFPNGIGAGTTELVILRGQDVYAPFFLYLFKSDWYIAQGTKYFKGVVGQQRVNKEIFTTLQIEVPPYDEQVRIVNHIKRLFHVLDIMTEGL